MTITVEFKTLKRRFDQGMIYDLDASDVDNVVFDYSGEIGSDTLSTAIVKSDSITAATPVISGNTVTIQLSNGSGNGVAKIELKVTTAAGKTLANVVRFRVKENYDNFSAYQDGYWG